MSKFKILLIVFVLNVTSIYARAPLESYKNYIFLLVHGLGGNNMKKEDNYNFPNQKEEGESRKSAIWDISYDDKIPTVDANNWMGDVAGNMFDRGFIGHTVWYDFFPPWKHPNVLAHELGDREYTKNPMFDSTNHMGITPASFNTLVLPFVDTIAGGKYLNQFQNYLEDYGNVDLIKLKYVIQES